MEVDDGLHLALVGVGVLRVGIKPLVTHMDCESEVAIELSVLSQCVLFSYLHLW